MRRSTPVPHLPVFMILGLAVLVPNTVHGSTLDTDVLTSEVNRLGTLVTDPALGERGERLRSIHQQAAEALKRGHVHWAFQHLHTGLVLSASFRYVVEQKQVTDLEAFDKLWQDESPILEQARRAGLDPSCQKAPSQVRAVVERAANRAQRHYRASRAMARAADPASGLFYLGRARAEVELVRLCETFRVAEGGTVAVARQPAIPPLSGELLILEEATDLAYEVPNAAIERHADFIDLNASLKELGELNEAGLSFGALDRLLAATLRSSLLRASSPEAPTTSELRHRIDRLTAKLTADDRDHSIALAYLEGAVATLVDPTAEAGGRIAAERTVDRVLPAYLALVGLENP